MGFSKNKISGGGGVLLGLTVRGFLEFKLQGLGI